MNLLFPSHLPWQSYSFSIQQRQGVNKRLDIANLCVIFRSNIKSNVIVKPQPKSKVLSLKCWGLDTKILEATTPQLKLSSHCSTAPLFHYSHDFIERKV